MTRDAETYEQHPAVVGGPVDPPPESRTLYGTVTGWREQDRPPIVPAWARNAQQRRQAAADAARVAGYVTAYHAARSPKYLAKIAMYAPVGVFVGARRVLFWALDTEGWGIRQNAARHNNTEDYLRLSHQRDRRVRGRLQVVGPACLLLAIAIALLVTLTPAWVCWAVAAVVAAPLAWVGRPPDRPIIDRTLTQPRFVKLTAEQVRTALCSIALGGMKDPAAIEFPPPGIHRDGPGWLARVNLPAGVTAVKVMERREELSSALRLPVDQVWPAVGPGHAGQLDLWVGYTPASRMGRPRWELATPTALTSFFAPIPFGVDQRMRPVSTTPFQRNYLIGGQPGSGKTFAGRALVLGALLDPTAEVWLAAFKPSEDFYDVAGFCSRYVCGIDDATMADAQRMVADGLREVQRRQTVLGRLKREGRIREGATSAELASLGLGLHPLLLVFDEVHELFLESKQAVADMIRLIKQGRSAGVAVVLITQVASKDAVPPEITRCVSSRWCLSVSDQVANDQIMGTGAYKRGQTGTVYRPQVDAGWGVTAGMSDQHDGPARAYYPDEDELAAVLARIGQLRAGTAFDAPWTEHPGRDLLDDVLRVFAHTNRPGLHWVQLAELLAQAHPQAYGDITADAVSTLLRDRGVPSVDVKVDGTTRKGARHQAVTDAAQARQITAEEGSGPTPG